MWREVVEISASGNVGLHAPRQVGAVVVEVARRHGKPDLHIHHLAHGPVRHELEHALEVRQIAAIVCHEARHARRFCDAVDAAAILVVRRHGLFHVDRLAALHSHDGVGSVGGGRRGDVDGIHLAVVHEFLRVGVPAFHAVALGIRLRFLGLAAHHGHHLRTFHGIEGRSAFLLGHFSATDKSPFYLFQVVHSITQIVFAKIQKRRLFT